MARNKVVINGETYIDLTGTTATADKVLLGYGAYGKDGKWMIGSAVETGSAPAGRITQDEEGFLVLSDEEGRIDLNWIASDTPTPNVRNFFYALKQGTFDHGEYTPANLPNNAFVDVFTLTTVQTPPNGIIFIDKEFYEGISSFPHMSSESFNFCWWDKSFINPAADNSTYPKYYSFKIATDQTRTTVASHGGTGFVVLDGSSQTYRARWQFVEKTLQVKVDYTNNTQFTPFERNRTYIWIAY
jgi:hypothetical protein